MLVLRANPDPRVVISVGIADEHDSMVNALTTILEESGKFKVTLKVFQISELIPQLSTIEKFPDVLLIGFYSKSMWVVDIIKNIKASHPELKTIALCMDEDQQLLIRLTLAGCRGWILMDKLPNLFEDAIIEVHHKGYHNADKMSQDVAHVIRIALERKNKRILTEEEKKYLSLACCDLSFKEIVDQMNMPKTTLDHYWNRLCDKLHVETRAGLVLEAFSMGLNNHSAAAEVSRHEG